MKKKGTFGISIKAILKLIWQNILLNAALFIAVLLLGGLIMRLVN